MYLTDPTLYGATLPQREVPLRTPIFGHMVDPWQHLPVQTLPWQNAPVQTLPWQNSQLHGLPYQQIPLQNAPWQQFVPPTFQHNASPFAKQPLGYTAPYMTVPYAPMGSNPQAQNGFFNVPFYGWQRPW